MERSKPGRFEEFYGLLQHVHKIPNVEVLVGYTDIHGDLLPINNDDNYHKAVSTANPLLRIFIQRKGKHFISIAVFNGFMSNACYFLFVFAGITHSAGLRTPESFEILNYFCAFFLLHDLKLYKVQWVPSCFILFQYTRLNGMVLSLLPHFSQHMICQ